MGMGCLTMRSIYFSSTGQSSTNLSLEGITEILSKKDGFLWLDLDGDEAETCEPILINSFGFHPLAVEDALQEVHVPKVNDWGDYLYMVLHTGDDWQGDHLETAELDLFVGKNYLVTYHVQTIHAIDTVWETLKREVRLGVKNIASILYDLLDEIAMDYMRLIDEIDEQVEGIEDRVVHEPDKAMLENLIAIKRSLLSLRRVISPQREVLNKLARGDFNAIEAGARIYYRDVYDHYVRIQDILESLRDLVSGVLDTYLSVVNNRMNDVMKILTIITTLFMPLSFLTGFFGMNYFQPVENMNLWTSSSSLVFLLIIMGVMPLLMLWMMHKNKWL